jgi:NADH:ubiquinone oxidoreductase subunit F (NADH-binding)
MKVWLTEINDLSETMKSVSACGLGMAAPLVVESLIKHFPEQVKVHVESKGST